MPIKCMSASSSAVGGGGNIKLTDSASRFRRFISWKESRSPPVTEVYVMNPHIC